ncbi:MAG: Na+/H+ antiporter [Oscillospiraceae bacterium]|nr:Na+/H+ antiporter [Oscillospiraceae bacterium]
MILFDYILILLFAILISNFINKFIPVISVPIIQIFLGIGIALLPIGFHLELNPELFFVLFIAPLLFNEGMLTDKKSLWSLKRPIFLLAFGLVFITVLAIGGFINILMPAIPLAACFALAAALAPTDAVAVGNLAKRIKIPSKITNILEGESLINDASGLVCFQFAIAAMLTGTFSATNAGITFLVIAIGGALVGAVFTLIKYIFIRWIRSYGMENVTLHILIEILTPFIIYIIAEKLGVSGVLAVVVAGIIHSFNRKRLNPETASLNIASQSIWSMLSFTLNGLVFLILGTQLPDIIKIIWNNSSINNIQIILYIVLFTIALLLVRFLWSIFIIKKDIYNSEDNKLGRFNTSLIISMSGARGTVTLASAMAIPLLLLNGSQFPERNLIIFMASGVIICSLLISNFLLPVLLKKNGIENNNEDESEALTEILNNVIADLNSEVTTENKLATEIVIRNYQRRIMSLQQKGLSNVRPIMTDEEKVLKIHAIHLEQENTKKLAMGNEISSKLAEYYLIGLNKRLERYEGNKQGIGKVILDRIRFIVRFYGRVTQTKVNQFVQEHDGILKISESNYNYVVENLNSMKSPENQELIDGVILEYQSQMELIKSRSVNTNNMNENITEVTSAGFQLERDHIQTMFECSKISRETANKMIKNISFLEIQMQEM